MLQRQIVQTREANNVVSRVLGKILADVSEYEMETFCPMRRHLAH